MDWKKTFNAGLWTVHGIFVVGIIAAILSTVYALRLTQFQSTEKARAAKVEELVKGLKEDQSFDIIAKFLSRAQADKAQETIHQLNRMIAETENLLELKASQGLRENIRVFNGLITESSGNSNPIDVLKVLDQKVRSLKDVARSQNYRNVFTISEQMGKRLEGLNTDNVGSSPQVRNLVTDLKRLEKLVQNSSLTDGEKNSLQSRFDSMSQEITLLSSLNDHSKDLQKHVTSASLALGEWVLELEKKGQNLESIRERKQDNLIIFMAAVVAFFTLGWLTIAYLSRWQKNKIGAQVEAEVKNIIERGIMGDERFMVDHFSEKTRNEIIQLLDGLKVKLNLGTMLHSGLPFAGCLIDNNFKVTWHNQLFLEQFYLSEEEVKSQAFNWDYLREYLNLDQDPVYEALVNKIAGIFPVKIKQDEFAPAQPYEMYVTPVFANREDRVMIFFYPLVSVKDSIDEQVAMSTSTMSRFLELWSDERLNDDELRLLEKDFESNDLRETFEHLRSVYERVSAEKNECVLTIHSLEKENQGMADTIAELHQLQEEKKDLIRQEFILSNSLKESFIHTLERTESLTQINKSILQQNDELRTEATRMQQTQNQLLKQARETLEVVSQLEQIRPDLKKLKFDLLEIKTRLVSLSGHLQPGPGSDDSQIRLFGRVREEVSRLDQAVASLEKKLSTSDILHSKLQMTNEKVGPEQTSFSWQNGQKDHVLKETLTALQRSMNDEEKRIIETMQSLNELMKLSYGKSQEASQKSGPDHLLS